MDAQPDHRPVSDAVQSFLANPRFVAALSVSSIGVGVFAFATRAVMGWPGLNAIVATLAVLCILSGFARREVLDRPWFMPVSLLAFLAWATLSIFWSQYQWATLGGLAYLAGFTVLGVFVALMRDMIQVIRDVGDVLRVALLVSIVLEVFSGLLIDTPIEFLGITASLAEGGPISGIVGNRNDLGMLCVVAAVSFAMEWRTRAVTRGRAVFSVALTAIVLLFTGSPIAFGTLLVAGAATGVLWLIRRLPVGQRVPYLWAALVLAVVALVVAWANRSVVIRALNADGELTFRLTLWERISWLVPVHRLEGWGWIGLWQTELPPYPYFATGGEREAESALNAYWDVALQLGVVGLVLFVAMLGLAFVRSWMLAANRRSVVYTWPAVVLVSLGTSALAESSVLVEFGWLLLVVCAAKASQEQSWRAAFRRPLEADIA